MSPQGKVHPVGFKSTHCTCCLLDRDSLTGQVWLPDLLLCHVIIFYVHVLNSDCSFSTWKWKQLFAHSEYRTSKSGNKKTERWTRWAPGRCALSLCCSPTCFNPAAVIQESHSPPTPDPTLPPLDFFPPNMFPLPFESGPNERDICTGGRECLSEQE